MDLYKGNVLIPSVLVITLPCDLIALVERLDIMMASKAVGRLTLDPSNSLLRLIALV